MHRESAVTATCNAQRLTSIIDVGPAYGCSSGKGSSGLSAVEAGDVVEVVNALLCSCTERSTRANEDLLILSSQTIFGYCSKLRRALWHSSPFLTIEPQDLRSRYRIAAQGFSKVL